MTDRLPVAAVHTRVQPDGGRVIASEEVAGQPHQTPSRPAHRAGEDAAETEAVPSSPHRRPHRQDRTRPPTYLRSLSR
jgi:hypothetical protein